jgi:hypothetical protein
MVEALILVGFGVALGVLVTSGVAARRAARRRRATATPPRPPAATGATWTAAGGMAAAFPLERTDHERNLGDAAFVDGLIVGRYYLPHHAAPAEFDAGFDDEPLGEEVDGYLGDGSGESDDEGFADHGGWGAGLDELDDGFDDDDDDDGDW